MTAMKQIRIEKVTLNIGAGKDTAKLERGVALLQKITGIQPVKTKTHKRIPEWGLRPGLPIGCKLTIRGQSAVELIKRLLVARDNKVDASQFDDAGNVSFGITEYIDIPEMKYDPDIGMMGFEVCVTLSRPGFRIKNRKLKTKKIPQKHRINQEEAIEFMKSTFQLITEEESEDE